MNYRDYENFKLGHYRIPAGHSTPCDNPDCGAIYATDGTEKRLAHPAGLFDFDKVEFYPRCLTCGSIVTVTVKKEDLQGREALYP